ncbi:MAG: hypothetical protein IPO67_31595 [Deltaproteobacteria bacterium]|nr:hypothetical protein [Deltaproteobacteria bacterium]
MHRLHLLPTMSPGAENANNDCVPTDDAPERLPRSSGRPPPTPAAAPPMSPRALRHAPLRGS